MAHGLAEQYFHSYEEWKKKKKKKKDWFVVSFKRRAVFPTWNLNAARKMEKKKEKRVASKGQSFQWYISY